MYLNGSISVFLDIAKFADFRKKNADVSRTQAVCHVIHIVFGTSLGINLPIFIIVGYVWQILGRGGGFLALPIREQPQKSPTWIGLKQKSNIAILKCQISRFLSKFVSLKQLSWQQTNYHFVTFSHMYDKISSCKKFKKICWVDPEKMHHRHKDGQMDRWTGLIS